MGVTGAGKSTFIQTATQNKDVIIGHGLESETEITKGYDLKHKGTKFVLVDCPGFNDTERSDEEILDDIVQATTMVHLEIL